MSVEFLLIFIKVLVILVLQNENGKYCCLGNKLGDMAKKKKKLSQYKFSYHSNINTNNYHEKFQVFISFKFKGRFFE